MGRQAEDCRDADSFLRGGGSGIFRGGQGTGKSTFFKYLAIKDEWFTDDVKRLDDKKVYEYLQGHWIVEMSEMNAPKALRRPNLS